MNNFVRILLFSTVALNACGEKTKQNQSLHNNKEKKTQNALPKSVDTITCFAEEAKIPKSQVTAIRFDKLSIVIHQLEGLDEKHLFHKRPTGDTTEIYYDLDESIFGQKIYVPKCNVTNLKIEFAYETSLSINFGGEHFDLLDWKHFRSKWIELSCSNGIYQIPEISRKEATQFPKYSKAELEEKSIKDSLPGVYLQEEGTPLVGVSRVFIRITGKAKGKRISYLAVFYEPMGC